MPLYTGSRLPFFASYVVAAILYSSVVFWFQSKFTAGEASFNELAEIGYFGIAIVVLWLPFVAKRLQFLGRSAWWALVALILNPIIVPGYWLNAVVGSSEAYLDVITMAIDSVAILLLIGLLLAEENHASEASPNQ